MINSIIPVLVIIFVLGILLSMLYLLNSWVNKYLNLKKEQNELLREIANKMNR